MPEWQCTINNYWISDLNRPSLISPFGSLTLKSGWLWTFLSVTSHVFLYSSSHLHLSHRNISPVSNVNLYFSKLIEYRQHSQRHVLPGLALSVLVCIIYKVRGVVLTQDYWLQGWGQLFLQHLWNIQTRKKRMYVTEETFFLKSVSQF